MATLSTLDPQGAPYGSLLNFATAPDGAPIVFLSRLAWHTQHLERDARACLLVSETGDGVGDGLTRARISLMGRFVPVARVFAAPRYLARHPEARLYIDFKDFSFRTLEIEKVHAVAGFGRIETFERAQVLLPSAQVAEFVSQIGVPAIADVEAADPEGIDLVREGNACRVNLPEPVFGAAEWLAQITARLSHPSALP